MIPSTINITGMSDLLQFSGLSLDTILAALESTADDLVGTDQQLLGTVGWYGRSDTGEVTGGTFNVYSEVWGTARNWLAASHPRRRHVANRTPKS